LEKEKFDLVFSIGVFERMGREQVFRTLRDFHRIIVPSGRICMYFLSDRAKGSPLTQRLGDNAYVFWKREEIEAALDRTGWHQLALFPWGDGGRQAVDLEAPADVTIANVSQ